MKLYFVRHGESQGNVAGIHQSGSVALSENGIIQAQKVAERFATIAIDVIFASDYTRALETAKKSVP